LQGSSTGNIKRILPGELLIRQQMERGTSDELLLRFRNDGLNGL
jgi:hypothetical protein